MKSPIVNLKLAQLIATNSMQLIAVRSHLMTHDPGNQQGTVLMEALNALNVERLALVERAFGNRQARCADCGSFSIRCGCD